MGRDEPRREPNRLIKEKSPYLLKHAFNPVDWYSWGDEALGRAKNDNKPIFLSIGYSSCHWCSVMERESFEDRKTAEIINKNFIPIKVDREERPEVDSYYMSAVQGMTGQGGWPLTVFLTPELKAFYGGTYFPPEPRYGMPSFRQVLEFVAKLWKDSRGEVTKEADRVADALQKMNDGGGGGSISPALLDDTFAALVASFDPEHGGFGGSPKFPLPLSLEFMLSYHYRTGKELALKAVTKTLEAMASGGIHDHVGGGFHRYSTDRVWLVPHFEKMLYDNALLARAYVHAFELTGERTFAEVAEDTLGWMMTELQSPEGGFFSAQDADTEEGEGVYYTWTPEEVGRVVGERKAEIFCYVYGVTRSGNFEGGRTILHRASSLESAASKFGTSPETLKKILEESKAALYKARLERQRPATDSKILTSWNGLAISALAQSFLALGDSAYANGGVRAAEFVLSKSVRGGELMRRYADGEAGIPATLEDHAFFGLGLVDLFEATSQPRWLEESLKLAEKMRSSFEDEGKGGFYGSAEKLPARLMESYDGPVPSGNSAAIMLLLRLSAITGREEFRGAADKALRRFQQAVDNEPTSHAFMLLAADRVLNGSREVVVSAVAPEEAEPFLRKLRGRFLPEATSFLVTKQNQAAVSRLTSLVDGRLPRAQPLAYVCENYSCKLPAKTPEELEAQLGRIRS